MKFTTTLSVTSGELALVKDFYRRQHGAMMDQPNLAKALKDIDIEKEVSDLIQAIKITYKINNSFHNLAYLFKIKDTIELDLCIEIDQSVFGAVFEYQFVIYKAILPLIDGIVGFSMNFNADALRAELKALDERFSSVLKPTTKVSEKFTGEAVN
jgi:hypothetical protein